MRGIIQLCLITLLLSACSTYDKTSQITDETRPAVIPLELTTHLGDQQQFIEGDEIQFLLSLGQDAYIYMYYVDAVNNITQILPNENQPGNFYTAGYFIAVPDPENHYRFTVSKPFGDESIRVFASDRSIAMKRSPGSIENIKQFIKKSSSKAYGDYVLKITTRER